MAFGTLLLLVLLLGALCGLRTFTPIALTAIAAHQGWLHLGGTPFAFLATNTTLALAILLALAELVVDKLPSTPSRLRPAGLIGRATLGAVTAVAFAFARQHSIAVPLVLGVVGALLGAYLGSRFRSGLVRALKSPDLPVALLEDAICIVGSLLIVTRS